MRNSVNFAHAQLDQNVCNTGGTAVNRETGGLVNSTVRANPAFPLVTRACTYPLLR